MRLCTFEDASVGGLAPLTTARPAIDLLCGLSPLGTKHRRAMRATTVATFVRPALARVAALNHPHVNESDWLLQGPTVMVNARWVPPPRFVPPATSDGPFVAVIDGVVAYAVLFPNELSDCTPHTIDECLREWRKQLTIRLAPGRLAAHPWDLVEWTGDEIATDFAALSRDEVGNRPSTLTLVGPSSALWVHDSARVDPFVVADTTDGPVVIDRDAVVTSFTRLEGPCYVGPRTQVFSANIRGGTSLGPNCRVGGEVSSSVLLANSNKSHEGYLGHSYVGEWVNIGAGTHFSDLRNDYADVRVPTAEGPVPTGLTKVGAYLGDHSKAGIGCRLNSGTSVGPFAQLLPCADLLPKYVPPFCTVNHGRLVDCADPHPLFEAAVRVTARRGEEFSAEHRALFKGLFDRGASHRRTVVHETELRRLRRG
jgi:UDP-N-acetylglucosamine diphosphorylase / glucose-1-phosphate thymidylyltransferase / UDP-N-acetylgalactosamine diphosphorylase / glucosamine-1-phosphate N-acetyltransferase / galactosamine-1-phosphate N-acetyltransferase